MSDRVGRAASANGGEAGVGRDALILAGLTLRQLRLVHALGEHGQMQRAAAHLRVSQPAASKLLSQTEAVTRATLFERRPRGLVPTPCGEALLRHAGAVLTEIALAGEEIAALRGGRGGRVAIGSVMAPAVETVAGAIGRIRREMARTDIRFEIDTSDVLVAKLATGELDLVVARIPPSVDASLFDYEEIAAEHACLVVRGGHPLLAGGGYVLSDTAGFDWVLQHRGALLRRSVESLLRRRGVPLPERVVETASFLATMVLVSSTDAIAPVALPVANLMVATGNFRALDLPEPLLVEPYGLISLRGRPHAPVVSAFRERLAAAFRDPAEVARTLADGRVR